MSSTEEFQVNLRLRRAPFMKARYGISDPTLYRYTVSGKIPKPRYVNNQRVWTDSQVEEADRNLISDEPVEAPPLPHRCRGTQS